MKNMIVGGVIVFAVALLAAQRARAQGTVYVSNLGQPSSGSVAAGSDSWVADEFMTGNNAGGYGLDSVQLAMTAASGAPNGFSALKSRRFSWPWDSWRAEWWRLPSR